MVDFQSRDTSRGYGDDEDEEADAEGDGAEAAEGEPPDEPDEGEPSEEGSAGEPTEPEPADEPAVETEGGDATGPESDVGTGSDPEASDGESDADAAEAGGDPLDGSSGGASGDPLAPDTGDAGTGSSGDDTGTDPSTDHPDDQPAEGAARETTDDGRDADSSADDPLSPSSESDRASEGVGDFDDHPFADDEGGSETAAETEADSHSHGPDDRSGDPADRSPDSGGHAHGSDDHSHGTDDRSHGSDEHPHGTDDHAHGSDGHSHDAGGHGHESGGHAHGHSHGAEVGLLGVGVVTVSSTRTREDDASGDVIEAVIEAADHEVVTREILRDDLDGVQTALLNLTGRDDVDVVVTTGGTGVTPDDVTVEGARPLFDRELPGFGELFRILSYEEIGTRAMVSRATAGMVDGVPVFCLPGSEAAARLGTEELVVEEMAHLVSLARRDD
ncbi:molybdenum cofactor biosynthesis protein B [Halosimplex carlsbadense 2-9-1]|uniref:Molybdenum cofactor biosynthesis protein B n=1 Tax=Halosimplex carlsbadense 2-9-1 TaxID=797114 RepID=M0CLT1_9EURY|nr:molybdenum cofactor biosynthesis protein B [Halosimplex carlsbadense 2-9-1]